jgi:hypothetical protein
MSVRTPRLTTRAAFHESRPQTLRSGLDAMAFPLPTSTAIRQFIHGERTFANRLQVAARGRLYPLSNDSTKRSHIFVKAAARVNNRAENSHQPTRRRERQMYGFRDARRTQAFL